TLPGDTPHRSLLVLIAFLVATASLLLQGGTLRTVIRWVKPQTESHEALAGERRALRVLLAEVADGEGEETLQLEVIAAQREALLAARDGGRFSSAALRGALDVLDAAEVRLLLRWAAADEWGCAAGRGRGPLPRDVPASAPRGGS